MFVLALALALATFEEISPRMSGRSEDELHAFALPFVRRPVALRCLRLLPLGGQEDGDYDEWQHEIPEALDSDDVLRLVKELVAPEWWYEDGALLQIDPQGRLVAQAPAAVLREVEALIAHLGAELLSTDTVELELYPIRTELPELEAAPALLETASATQLFAAAQARGALAAPQRSTLRPWPGTWARAGGTRRTRFLRDVDVETSGSTAIADPVFSEVDLGTAIWVRAMPGRNATLLHLMLERSAALGAPRELSFAVFREFIGESGEPHRSLQSFPSRLPSIAFGSLAQSCAIPNGHTLVARQHLAAPGGRIGFVLGVTPQGRGRGGRVLELSSRALLVRDVGAWIRSGFERDEPLTRELLTPVQAFSQGQRRSCLVEPPNGNAQTLEEELEARFGKKEIEITVRGELLLLHGPTERVRAAQKWLDAAEAERARTHELRLELCDRSGATVLTSVQLAVAEGRTTFFSLGAEELAVVDYDVEVSCHADVCDPNVELEAHGVLGRLRVEASGESLSIELELAWNWQNEARTTVAVDAWPGATYELGESAASEITQSYLLAPSEAELSGDLDPEGPRGLRLRLARR